jgi:glycopeptide antibiotics resistance protein
MLPMTRISVSKRVVIVGTLLIWTIKFLVRPYLLIPVWLKSLTGVAPNLLGSFLLPFGACWFFPRIFPLQTKANLRFTCVFGLLLVIINEYLQKIPVFGRTFDYLDIVSSFVGVWVGYYAFAIVMRRFPDIEKTGQKIILPAFAGKK